MLGERAASKTGNCVGVGAILSLDGLRFMTDGVTSTLEVSTEPIDGLQLGAVVP